MKSLVWLAAVLPMALIAQSTPPTPEQLILRWKAARKAQEDKGWKYTYREDKDESQIDKNGKASTPVRKTYEHIMLEGENYKKLILIDGKRLETKLLSKGDAELQKTQAERKEPAGAVEFEPELFNQGFGEGRSIFGQKSNWGRGGSGAQKLNWQMP